MSDPAEALPALRTLLQRRLEIIADHAWRDRDPAGQLTALEEVSTEIDAQHHALRGKIPARLGHFLSQASYAKALDWLEAELGT